MKTLLTALVLTIATFTFGQGIKWKNLEVASNEVKANKNKKLFLFAYADWCGYCKQMDSNVFTDPKVIKYINDNFVAARFNSESIDPIKFFGINYVYMIRARVNYLAYMLGRSRLSLPAMFVFDSEGKVTNKFFGFRTSDQLIEALK